MKKTNTIKKILKPENTFVDDFENEGCMCEIREKKKEKERGGERERERETEEIRITLSEFRKIYFLFQYSKKY